MLYLVPPFPMINGVSLFPDHADPLQFYFLPLAPKLTRVVDPDTKQSIPQFQLIAYRGQAGSGGFLNFDVNIGVPPNALDDIRTELKQMLRLNGDPVLSPVPLIDGSVRMMLFGKQTADKPPDKIAVGNPGQPQFVLKIDQAAKPALYGDNQAAFSVALDQDGVTVLEAAMRGEMSPIGIVYSLDYLALRPAFNVTLNIDWDRVQNHMDESFGANTLFFSSQIDNTVDKLIDNRVINIQVDTFVPEGDDNSGIIASRDQAVNEVREMITDAFFKPSLDPFQEKKDDWDKAAETFDRISKTAATGGLGGDSLFSYKHSDYKRTDKKSLNVKINERTAVKRSIYPQGHLSGIFRELNKEGLDLSKFIIEANLDNPFFQRRTVAVISRANFEEDSIASVNATVRYGDNPQNAILESSTASKTVSWASIMDGGGMKRETQVGYRVNFKNVDSTDRPVAMDSQPHALDTDAFEINPRELYSIVHIKIIALSFPWDKYANVEVQTRYVDDPNHIRAVQTFLLKKELQETTWTLFVLDNTNTRFEYKIIYHATSDKDVELPWTETAEEQITIRNPFPKKLKVDLAVSSSVFADTERVFVDVSYEDPAHGILQSDSFKFTKDVTENSFQVDLADQNRRLVAYSVSFMLLNGALVEIPKSLTRLPRIMITRHMKGHRIIAVHPKPVDFPSIQLSKMSVELRYQSDESSASDVFTFDSKDGIQYFEFDYTDAQKSTYWYQVTYSFSNGLSRTGDWQQTEADDLAVDVG